MKNFITLIAIVCVSSLIGLGLSAVDGVRQVVGGTDTVGALSASSLPTGLLTNNQSTLVVFRNDFHATNGIASKAKNLTAPTSITVGSSPFNWTNSSATAGGGTNNVMVYIDAFSGDVNSVSMNGGQIGGSSPGVYSVPLQPGEYVTVDYAVAPAMKFKPF